METSSNTNGRGVAGRPTKLTPEIQEKIRMAIEDGNFRNIAGVSADVPEQTLSRWMAKGKRASKGIYFEFRQVVLKAEKVAEIRAVALIMQAAKDDPKHAQWWLERKHWKRWGRKDKLSSEISGPRGTPIAISAATLKEAGDELAQWRKEMQERLKDFPSSPPTGL